MPQPESLVTIESMTPLRGRRAQIANYPLPDMTMRLAPDTPPEVIKERAQELLDLGFRTADVARRLGIQPKQLRAVMSGAEQSPAIERRAKVSAMVGAGNHLEDIAKRLDVPQSVIREDLKTLRVNIPEVSTKGLRMGKRKAELRRLHAEGRTPGEIAETLGITVGKVRYTLDVLGLEWRGRFSAGS